MAEDRTEPMQGLRVLVTRPAQQADALCQAITAAGGHALRCPTITIEPVLPDDAWRELWRGMDRFGIVIFISANAVRSALQAGLQPGQLAGLQVAAIGGATAQALAQHGVEVAICPAAQFDSEGLLAEPALQDVAGQRILIVRGTGGREHLAQTLTARGAVVQYAEVYRRQRPAQLTSEARQALEENSLDVVSVSSSEALQNLWDLVPAYLQPGLLDTTLLVVSERVADLARALGFKHTPLIAASAASDDQLAVLRQWAAGRQSQAAR